MNGPLPLPMPVRLLQGKRRYDVPPTVAISLFHQIASPDLRLTLVKDADSPLFDAPCLAMITEAIEDVIRSRDALPAEDGRVLRFRTLA